VFSARGYDLFDDTVLDKHHSRRIELVRRQYSGNAHGVIAGIGLVTCVYVKPINRPVLAPRLPPLRPRHRRQDQARPRGWDAGSTGSMWHPLSDRAPGQLVRHHGPVQVAAGRRQNVLLPAENALQAFGSNRLIDDSGGQQPYQPVSCLGWSKEEVEGGKILKVKGMPKDYKLKRFRVLVSTHRTDYLLTNEV
jgi:hypothetical protein